MAMLLPELGFVVKHRPALLRSFADARPSLLAT
eukprot:CAMPEP_0180423102 /NCGR_PEP_ID=MMETSP1036_2-20121128/4035_1 /TAXON_ID=632150 /ORGANISM="Azadinium spinosum, Strain 3D9" /LENGTH=32 /DNA_ID= /DNA_START= /DNA_END= /DNA_ORIENTATION=